jgi:serine phosphatase RsbU (regulator of sigma subunit)
VSGTDYSTSIIELPHASRLVLVTDGVHEQRSSQNEQFGFDRMTKLLSSSTTCESDIELLVRELTAFAGTHFDDDVTILSIQRVE